MNEIWRPIPGYEGHYEASSRGQIRVLDRVVTKRHMSGREIHQLYKGKILKQFSDGNYGHLSVGIGHGGASMKCAVHRLVLLAFVGPPMTGQEACHNNGDATENSIWNLRWDSHLSNNQDRKRHGRYANGECHVMAKLSEEDARAIRGWKGKVEEAICKFGIGRSQYYRIRNNESWSHL